MSQHICECTTSSGRSVRVVAGYDRRLDELFLQVHDETAAASADDEEDENAVFFFAPPGWRSVQLITDTLERLGIVVPQTFVTGFAEDQRTFAGNRVVRHRLDGEPTVVLPG
jgi:hypothetical protein